jgi:hypothetical protein
MYDDLFSDEDDALDYIVGRYTPLEDRIKAIIYREQREFTPMEMYKRLVDIADESEGAFPLPRQDEVLHICRVSRSLKKRYEQTGIVLLG